LSLLLIVGCKKNNPVNTNHTNSIASVDSTIFIPDTTRENFDYNSIDSSKMIGKWKLNNVIFVCNYGRINHLEDFLGISDSNRVMKISATEMDKMYFWRHPYYAYCTYTRTTLNVISIDVFSICPSGGAPTRVYNFDYTNGILTFIYSAELILNKNSNTPIYNGYIYESYVKDNN